MAKCQGCGAVLQNSSEDKEGYTNNLENKLCERCFKIVNYNEYRFTAKNNEYYLNILNNIQKTNDLVLLVTDFLNTIDLETLNITNPIILVLAKRDIIPRSLDEDKLLKTISSKLNIIDKIIVGTTNNYNLDLLMDKIEKHKQSKNVYVIGYTSAGKSTLINKIIQNYGKVKTKITTSILPSTTLDLIDVKINDNLTIIDTPGLLDEGSMILNTPGEILNKIMPKKEIKPVTIQVKKDQTIIVQNIFKLEVTGKTNLTFYMSNDLKIERYFKKIENLNNYHKYQIDILPNTDIVIKGLGFIKATKECKATLYLDEKIKYIIKECKTEE